MLDVTTEPVVDRFLRRLLAFTPAQWAALDARLGAWFVERGYTGELPRELRWVVKGVGTGLRLLPIPDVAFRFFGDWLLARDGFAFVAPGWRRAGVGPLRLLIERMQQPGFPMRTRIWLPTAVHLVYARAHDGGDWQAQFYEPLEPFIPWAELVAEAAPR